MQDLARTERIVRFGGYQIDHQTCELRQAGLLIPLQIQPFRVLETLIAHAGEAVTRADLRARIWPATVQVDFDHGLNNAINRLRHALDDSAEAPRFIETLPRIGYRFIHALDHQEVESLPLATERRVPLSRSGIVVAAVVILGALGMGVFRWDVAHDQVNPALVNAARPTANEQAHIAYLRGIELLEQRSKESVRLSIEHLQRATEFDPGFAQAHAALAVAYVGAAGNTMMRYLSVAEAATPARVAAERALQLDPALGQAHLARARVLDGLQPWSVATDVAIEQSYRRALRLEPGAASTYLYFGNFLAKRGCRDEALMQFERACNLEPLSPSINSRLGMERIALGKTDAGMEYLRKTVELAPFQFNALVRLGWALIAINDLDAAQQEFEQAERISPNSLRSLGGLAFIVARKGDTRRARELLDTLLPLADAADDPSDVALIYVGLKDRERSIEWLAKTAHQTRMLHMKGPWGIGAPIYDWLRGDARFAQIEREIAADILC